MKTSHCDPRLLTRFTNRALVIGSSAALTLGLGMTPGRKTDREHY